jgi:Fic family protein
MVRINELLKRIDDTKKLIDRRRPLSQEEVRELDNYYRIGLTYSSNALEGNSLTLNETKVLLEDGITVGGKPIKDFYEATGHAAAYDFMQSVARSEPLTLSEDTVLKLHFLFYNGVDNERAGKYRDHQVFITGTDFLPPEAGGVPALMREFVAEINDQRTSLHPVLLAAKAHMDLVSIHPFADGNGRTARLLMNLILINGGYCVVSIPPVLRHEYISALQAAQRKDLPSDDKFKILIAECEIEAQKDYCRMLRINRTRETER